jgi:hypothetical protein
LDTRKYQRKIPFKICGIAFVGDEFGGSDICVLYLPNGEW